MKSTIYYLVCLLLTLGFSPLLASPSLPAEPTDTLTFQQVVERIWQHNPRLATFQYELAAKDGLIQQESLRPNPELSLELENFGVYGEFRGLRELESTVQLEQTLILGHKRQKKVAAAELDKALTLQDKQIQLADLITQAKKQFIELQVLQEKLALRAEMVELAESFQKKITNRIEVGHTSPLELPQAQIAVLRHQLAYRELLGTLAAARLRLASLWGASQADFSQVEKAAQTAPNLPQPDLFTQNLPQNPEMLRLASEKLYKQSLLTVARAAKVPDLTLSAGFRHLNGPGGSAFTIGASLPLPFSHKNQGEIAAAGYFLKKTEAETQATALENQNEVLALYETLKNTHEKALVLSSAILPGAAESIAITTNGYEMGKIPYLQVLDALRTHLEVREEYAETLGLFHQIQADLERVSGLTLTKNQPLQK